MDDVAVVVVADRVAVVAVAADVELTVDFVRFAGWNDDGADDEKTVTAKHVIGTLGEVDVL